MNRREFCLTAAALTVSACAAKSPFGQGTDKKRAFIIHGWGATPADHWFSWLSDGLKTHGYTVEVPALPNPAAPVFADWQRTLANRIGIPQPNDLFVAHSLGGITLLHYLSQTAPAEVGGLVLVSAFAEKLPKLPEIEGYSIDNYVAQARLNLPAIRAMTANTACIVSSNDSIVAPEASLKLANALQAHVITVPDAGHFLASDGFDTLPQVLQAVENFRSRGA